MVLTVQHNTTTNTISIWGQYEPVAEFLAADEALILARDLIEAASAVMDRAREMRSLRDAFFDGSIARRVQAALRAEDAVLAEEEDCA